MLGLVDMLWPDHVFLSIYENDVVRAGEMALSLLPSRIRSAQKLVLDQHVDFAWFPTVSMPEGSLRVKRLACLSEMRNRALRPLDDSPRRFDKVLSMNDVAFRPPEGAQLLFTTNADMEGGGLAISQRVPSTFGIRC